MSVQLVSKISNLCDPDPPTSQTDGQTDRRTDRRTDGQHAISIPCYALVHRAVKMEKLIADQSKLLEKAIESMNAYFQNVSSSYGVPVCSDESGPECARNRSGQRSRVPVNCYNCSQFGHIARNCPMVVTQNKEVTSANESENNVGQDGGMISDSPVNSPIPHMRSISEKQVKTCIKVKYRSYKLTALLDTCLLYTSPSPRD